MKRKQIGVIGQPTHNIGDLAAFRAFNKLIFDATGRNPVYFVPDSETPLDSAFGFNSENGPECYRLPRVSRIRKLLFLIMPCLWGWIERKLFGRESVYQKFNIGFLVLAPGGLEIGLYKNWRALHDLYYAKSVGLPFGLYSRSIGGFQKKKISDWLFYYFSIKILKSSSFNGLRDRESQGFALRKGIPFVGMFDIVFSVPAGASAYQGICLSKPYAVVSVSDFRWHKRYREIDLAKLKRLYIVVITHLVERYGYSVCLLPHVYRQDICDEMFLEDVIKSCRVEKDCMILKDCYDSDLYQLIISESCFSFNSRSHQTVFAIKSRTPFWAVSYEPKISAMLEELGVHDLCVSIESFVDMLEDEIVSSVDEIISEKESVVKEISSAFEVARRSSLGAFKCFREQILDKYLYAPNESEEDS